MAAPRRALLSVSDKTGLAGFARALAGHGYGLISTGGTATALRAAGLDVTDVAAVTGFPEIMDGRVKTLHPKIHGGLLGRRDKPEHAAAMAAHGIAGIDMLVCNLYPFEATLAGGGGFDDCIENIDIGGPAMIRAAAKNVGHVAVVTDPADYDEVLAELAAHGGGVGAEMRKRLSARAYSRTAAYDAAISTWLRTGTGETTPRHMTLGGTLRQTLRYGENPHQSAAFYVTGEARPGVATARQVQGRTLSYNNINDTDAAFELVADLGRDRPAVAIIKHANPCGVATGASFAEAYGRALQCDPVSAFGGVVALNGRLDEAAAGAIGKVFTEVVIAPEADEAALEVLGAKKNVRVLLTGGLPDPAADGLSLRTVAGGFLAQGRDNRSVGAGELEVVTKRAPTEAELADLVFAFRVAKHVKSNAIVYVKDGATVGIGAGQMSRVDSSRIAARKSLDAAAAAGLAEPLAKGSVVASDAFFPFADGLLAAAEAGATAVIQPGGSMRDDEVIAAADEAGLAMVLTGVRHFRH
jgi:phosphoribosylaminoimidazolecarboxamide formyltransferase/IMP cyclohydrolase